METRTRESSAIVTLALLIIAATVATKAQNPVIQTNYTADPAPMVYNDTVYLYTTHDEDVTVNNFFTMNDWRCYSSVDMVNWTDHGAVLSYTDFNWSRGDAWAGQCIYRNGKFYFYVPMNQKNGGNAIGVAVSDSPTGPFKDALGKPLLVGYGYIDPTVYIDDDGQAYLYWGNPELCYVKLNEDMVSYNQQVGVVKVPLTVEGFGPRDNTDRTTSYEEGPWFFKRNNLYYLLYPGGPLPEHLAYSTSTGPTGPWKYKGKIMNVIANKGAFTNHPGLVDFKGKSYLFYHNAGLPGGGGYTRSVCVEEFNFNPDSAIPLLTPTSGVKNAVKPLDPFRWNEAETIAWESGIKTGSDNKTGVYVTNIDNAGYLKVRAVDFGKAGAAAFAAKVACETKPGVSEGGAIEIRLDAATGALIGSLPVSYTGDLNTWTTEWTNIEAASGVHDVYFVFNTQIKNAFNFDKWCFLKDTTLNELVAIHAVVDKYKIDKNSGSNTTGIKVVAIYSNGNAEDVTSRASFQPQEAGLVSVSDGIVTGTAYGTASVKVEFGGLTDEMKIIVKNIEGELSVGSLLVDPQSVELLTGTTAPLTITARFVDGREEDVTKLATFSNPDLKVATISNGTITAGNSGIVTITASYKGQMGSSKSASFTVKVFNRSPFVKNEAEKYSQQSGIQTEACSDTGGTDNVGFIENGDWLKIDALDFGQSVSSFEVRAASATTGGMVEIHLDSLDGKVVGTCHIPATGGWQTWRTQSCAVEDFSGVHDVYLVFKGDGGFLFNLNWWLFKGGVNSVVKLDGLPSPSIISKQNEQYMKGIMPGDIITMYNGLGRKIKAFSNKSDSIRLAGTSGLIVVEVKRGVEVFKLKTVLK